LVPLRRTLPQEPNYTNFLRYQILSLARWGSFPLLARELSVRYIALEFRSQHPDHDAVGAF
jgi:hypothetical protein